MGSSPPTFLGTAGGSGSSCPPVMIYLDAPTGKVFLTPGTAVGEKGGLGQGELGGG